MSKNLLSTTLTNCSVLIISWIFTVALLNIWYPLFSSGLHNKGRFCNNNEIDTLISKQLSVENKAKRSQLEIVNKKNTAENVF